MATNAERGDRDFYATVPVFAGFPSIMDPAQYAPLPDDWLIAITDVRNSTQAIEAGRYKAVNTAGAAIIAALTNALARRPFPFVFGGDGATLAVSSLDEAAARAALAATAAWSRDELGLALRAALIPVAVLREQGLDVRVARYRAVAQRVLRDVQRGRAVRGGPVAQGRPLCGGARRAGRAAGPVGLSCRWNDIPATRGVIVSLVVAPVTQGDPAFRALVEALLQELETSAEVARAGACGRARRRLAAAGTGSRGARVARARGRALRARLRVAVQTLLAYFVFLFGIRVGEFDPAVYRRTVYENSDFRKYDDVLRMTLDCTAGLADRIEARLRRAADGNVARFGLHRQSAALMTCIVPSIADHDHVHFVDGADGGYASAARQLKQDTAAAGQ